jgi:hypothetical protein
MKSPLSPSDIEVLIWYHTRPARHERINAPAVQEATQMFCRCGMIRPRLEYDEGYMTTEKGNAFIEALRNTQEPVAVWTVPERKEK